MLKFVFVLIASLLGAATSFAQVLERSSPDCSAKAQERVHSGVERNEPASIYLMARYYSMGNCVPGDGQKAFELYQRAAKLEYPPAFYNLGMISASNGSYASAAEFLLMGTVLGHRGSELQLGILYSLVPAPTGDDEKAFAWLSLTSSRNEQVSTEARRQLAIVSKRIDKASREKAEALYASLKEKYGPIHAFKQETAN